MSNSLVKRGLELFEEDLKLYKDDSNSKRKKKNNPMKLIGTNKKGVRKELRKVKRLQETQKAAHKNVKPSNDIAKKLVTDDVDYTSINLENINRMSFLATTSSCSVDKILSHGRERRAVNQPADEKVKEEGSIFTDRDFDVFEKEYFHKT